MVVSDPSRSDDAHAWGERLLEALLPLGGDGATRLLACDDGVVATVAASFGLDRNHAVPAFVEAVDHRWQLRTEGLELADQARRNFDARSESPRGIPEFLPVCLLLVLAASRMNSDLQLSSSNYYHRLMGDLLGRPALVLKRPEAVPQLFGSVACWLATDLGGARGAVPIPEDPHPKYVGVPISQCVFRARDRAVLLDFFDARWFPTDGEFDPLRLLQHWSGRRGLSSYAQRQLEDPSKDELIRAAIVAARQTWDESTVTDEGHNRWRGTLRLEASGGVVKLFLRAPNTVEIPVDGRVLRPEGEVRLDPLETLPALREQTLTWGVADRVVLPAAGDTLIFEHDPRRGVVRVNAATAEHVWVLSCNPDVRRSLADREDEDAEDDLPRGWGLAVRVPADRLPAEWRRADALERPPLAVEGGLRIGYRTWLVGSGPTLRAGALEEPVELEMASGDGELTYQSLGELRAREVLDLCDLALGTHRIRSTGQSFSSTLRIEATGVREAWGSIRWPHNHEERRFGARRRRDGLVGAALDGPPPSWPILRASAKPVVVIDWDGRSRRRRPGQIASWLEEAGLPTTQRWELQRDDDMAWVIGASDVICVRFLRPGRIDEIAAQALRRLPQRPRVLCEEADRSRADARAVLEDLRRLAIETT